MLRNNFVESISYDLTAALAEEDLGTSGDTSGAFAVSDGLRRVITCVSVTTTGTVGGASVIIRNKDSTDGGVTIGWFRSRNNARYSSGKIALPASAGDEPTLEVTSVTGGGSVSITVQTQIERAPS